MRAFWGAEPSRVGDRRSGGIGLLSLAYGNGEAESICDLASGRDHARRSCDWGDSDQDILNVLDRDPGFHSRPHERQRPTWPEVRRQLTHGWELVSASALPLVVLMVTTLPRFTD